MGLDEHGRYHNAGLTEFGRFTVNRTDEFARHLTGAVTHVLHLTDTMVITDNRIDVGSPAIDRDNSKDSGYTYIVAENAANASGLITSVSIWAATNMTGLRVGTFYNIGGGTYKCRASADIGEVTAGSEQVFDGLSIAVVTGDFIGCYFASGTIERDALTGDTYLSKIGDYLDVDDEASSPPSGNATLSLYGTGVGTGSSGISKAVGKPLSDALAIADAIAKSTGKSESDSVAIADSLTKAIGKALSDSFGLADSLSKTVGKSESDSFALADTLSKAVGKAESDSLPIADVIIKAVGKNEADSIVITDDLTKAIGIIKAETMAIADSIVKDFAMPLADTMTITDAISKGMSKPLADAIAIVDSMVMTGSYARPGINVAAFLFKRAVNALLHERDIDSQLYPRDINAKSRREF